jgi:hypothetical protein
MIKNYRARTSLACYNLKGKYRWALSGTPIQNRLEELFPYLRFLRAPASNPLYSTLVYLVTDFWKWAVDYEEFRRYCCDPKADDAKARVDIILSIVML